MKTITRCDCEIAQKLSIIEQSLRAKAKQATSEIAIAGYAQAAAEIAKANREHFSECAVCQASEAQEAA
jgi:hypothetical protein